MTDIYKVVISASLIVEGKDPVKVEKEVRKLLRSYPGVVRVERAEVLAVYIGE